jgi:hypothetical protein
MNNYIVLASRVCGHGFCPFGEIVNDHNYVIMIGRRRGFTCSKINAPFRKGAKLNNKM